MAIKYSNNIPLGTKIKKFNLLDPKLGIKKSLDELKSDICNVIMFICNHCPYVKHINNELIKIATYYREKKIVFIAINSNSAKISPEDSPEKMIKVAKKLKYPFHYLFDETQEIAKIYNAACTPDFFIFNKNDILVYHGQLDDSRPDNNIMVTGKDIRNVINNIIYNKEINISEQKPSVGCSIKWNH